MQYYIVIVFMATLLPQHSLRKQHVQPITPNGSIMAMMAIFYIKLYLFDLPSLSKQLERLFLEFIVRRSHHRVNVIFISYTKYTLTIILWAQEP